MADGVVLARTQDAVVVDHLGHVAVEPTGTAAARAAYLRKAGARRGTGDKVSHCRGRAVEPRVVGAMDAVHSHHEHV